MENKYTVPAIEKANRILEHIAERPGELKLIDLSRGLGISKSSIYVLLQTMEQYRWIEKDKGDAYSLGSALGYWGSRYFQASDLAGLFRKEAPAVRDRLEESVQLAKLEGSFVLYLAKESVAAPVQMVSGPGVKFPAHATGLGKVLLSGLDREQFLRLYPESALPSITPYTIADRHQLWQQLEEVRARGFAIDSQEGVNGFSCVAAPVFNQRNEIEAAVSVSMPVHAWERKQALARDEVLSLARRLSFAY